MMGSLIAFLITPFGRWAAIAAMFVATWFAFAHHYENKGASRVVAQIEQKVEANAKTADAVRNSVRALPADRLRDAWTRD